MEMRFLISNFYLLDGDIFRIKKKGMNKNKKQVKIYCLANADSCFTATNQHNTRFLYSIHRIREIYWKTIANKLILMTKNKILFF